MKTTYNHLTHSYETPDKTTVAAEICEGDTPSDAFRAAAIREQQRTWVGLTQQDINIAFDDTQEGGGFDDFARAIEAKLREKNAQPSKPLTDEQIIEMYNEPRSDAEMLEFARAIEAAHGIKGDA